MLRIKINNPNAAAPPPKQISSKVFFHKTKETIRTAKQPMNNKKRQIRRINLPTDCDFKERILFFAIHYPLKTSLREISPIHSMMDLPIKTYCSRTLI